MPDEFIPPTCTTCEGSGDIGDQKCPVCFGQGTLPIRDECPLILKALADMRADLTTALTAIWNKVKNL